MIQGSDVRVPAHYHGSIVGITLALMGLTYALLPRLGFDAPLPRMATWQPVVYGAGQLMHITGLVWSGGYGVQRKVAGAEQVLRSARSGIFCVNDQLAAGVLGWCRDRKRRVPPIVGFDDAPIAEQLNLTTIGLPWDEMLDGVIRTAKRRLAGDRSASSHQMFHPKPTIRSLEVREPPPSAAG